MKNHIAILQPPGARAEDPRTPTSTYTCGGAPDHIVKRQRQNRGLATPICKGWILLIHHEAQCLTRT
jgi:hypothetical protein